MKVELREETAAAMDRRVRAGEFSTADELVLAGLRALDEQRSRQVLRDKIAVGVAEVEEGEGIDGNEVFRELLSGLNVPVDGPK